MPPTPPRFATACSICCRCRPSMRLATANWPPPDSIRPRWVSISSKIAAAPQPCGRNWPGNTPARGTRIDWPAGAQHPNVDEAIMRRRGSARMSFLQTHATWLRLIAAAALLWWMVGALSNPHSLTALFAQETNPTLEDVEAAGTAPDTSPTPPAADRAAVKHRTFIDSIRAGGWIGAIIILMSIVAVGFVIEHALTIRKQRLMPDAVL